jgi:hypothetical protein
MHRSRVNDKKRGRGQKPGRDLPPGCRRAPRFELLEDRRLLAVTASFSPQGVVTLTGDAQADSVDVFADSGFLRYTGAQPAATALNILLENVASLVIDLGGGTDVVRFIGSQPLTLPNGALTVTNAESIRIATSIHTVGGQDFVNGNLLVDVASATLSAGGEVLIGGRIDDSTAAANPVPVDGNLFLAWQRSLGQATGATLIKGDLEHDGDVDAADLSLWRQSVSTLAHGGNNALTIEAGGNIELKSNVGGVGALNRLTLEAGGTVILRGALIYVGDRATFNGPVRVNVNNLVLDGDVTFNGTINGDSSGTRGLSVSSRHTSTFQGAIGGTLPLREFRLIGSGTTILGAGTVTTAGTQIYVDKLILARDTVLTDLAWSVNFGVNASVNGTTIGEESLEVRAPEVTNFECPVGGYVPLEKIVTDAAGRTSFFGEGKVVTIGDQIYNDNVTVRGFLALQGRDITLAKSVNSDLSPSDLTIEAERTAKFMGTVSLQNLVVRTGSTAMFSGNVFLQNLLVRTGSAATSGALTINSALHATRDIILEVRESTAVSVLDDLTLTSTALLDAGRNVELLVGDDLTIASGAVIDADGQLIIYVDAGDNDAAGATISTITNTPASTNATGMLRGGLGIDVRGAAGADVLNLQASRLVTPNAVNIQGYATDRAASGPDEFLLVFSSNELLAMGSLLIDGGEEPGIDRLTLDHSKDSARRDVEVFYTSVYGGPGSSSTIDGSAADFLGLGTLSGFHVAGMDRYVLKAALAPPPEDHDHLTIHANDQLIPTAPDQDFLKLEQEIRLSSDTSGQWQVTGWESAHLIGSNVRDVIDNNTSIPTLIEGKRGNDTIVGGSSLDVIFSGPGATLTPSGAAIYFNVGAPDSLLAPGLVRQGDVIAGAAGDDFLFADVELFRDGATLWGLVTLDSPGESDSVDGTGRGSSAATQVNHGARYGATDVDRALNGALVLSGSPNALIADAFFANNPASRKVGLLSPPYNALLSDFRIVQRPINSLAALDEALAMPSDDMSRI